MVGVYKSLTDFLPMLEDDKIGESEYLFVMRDYLVGHGMKYDETIDNKVTARKNGKTYGFSEHLQAMVYSLLSAQRS